MNSRSLTIILRKTLSDIMYVAAFVIIASLSISLYFNIYTYYWFVCDKACCIMGK